jgi:tetratricopeptide (TPR) repeat protein
MKTIPERYRHIYTKIEVVLKKEEWSAEGRLAGFQFALHHHNDVSEIQAEIQDWEERITHASSGDPLASNTSARIHRENYLQALRESLELISQSNYAAAIRRHPKDAQVYFDRGFAYFKADNMTEAIEDYTEAIRLSSRNPSFYFYRGLAYARAKKFDRAIHNYTESLRLSADNPDTYYNRGIAHEHTSNLDAAIQDYTKAIDLQPDMYTFYVNRGNAYYQKRDSPMAIADYTQAIRIHPSATEAYYNRGYIFAEQGQIAEAISDYELYLRYARTAIDRTQVEAEITRLKRRSQIPSE